MQYFTITLAVVAFIAGNAWTYPTGAPATVCDSMFPGHGADAQTTPIPYEVIPDKPVVGEGEEVKLTLSGKNGETFKGFLIEIREGDRAVGAFQVASGGADMQTIDCHGNRASAVTHTNPLPKTDVVLKWKAPSKPGKYNIYVTIVKEKVVFWAKEEVGTIEVN